MWIRGKDHNAKPSKDHCRPSGASNSNQNRQRKTQSPALPVMGNTMPVM